MALLAALEALYRRYRDEVMYLRKNHNVIFIWPAVAFGIDTDGRAFIECAWLCWAVGIGYL